MTTRQYRVLWGAMAGSFTANALVFYSVGYVVLALLCGLLALFCGWLAFGP